MPGYSVIRESGVPGSVGGVVAGSLGGGGHLEELGGADLDAQCAFCKVGADGCVVICSDCGGNGVRVDKETLHCLLKEKSGALKYCCCRYRIGSNQSKMIMMEGLSQGLLSAFDQLLNVVGVLARRVGEVSAKLDAKQEHQCRGELR